MRRGRGKLRIRELCAHVARHGGYMEATPVNAEAIKEQVIEVLRTCYDPEIPVNIYDLGLIYGIDVDPEGVVTIRMTLTAPACPAAEMLPPEVQAKVKEIAAVKEAKVELVWDPPWNPEMMSEAAKLQLGWY